MPHDRNGNLVEPGDTVTIICKVVSVSTSEEYCNANLETVLPMPPYDTPTNISAINTRQLEVIEKAQK